MATSGEIRGRQWGELDGHQWGEKMAAGGEKPMAIDTVLYHHGCPQRR